MLKPRTSDNKKKICFVDSLGKELFQISDRECIELIYGDGSYYIGICRYVDDLHFKLDGTLWNLHDFAKKMEQNKILYQKCRLA